MAVPELEAHGRKHRSFEIDASDEALGIEDTIDVKPMFDDDFDSQTLKYVAIGGMASILGAISIIAVKRLRDKRKES